MNAIALEMSGSYLSFAFLKNGDIVGTFHKKVGFLHESVFWKEFPKLFRRSKLSFKDLDYIAVTRGPGRFTGVRLGLAIANAWAKIAGVPVFAPSTLDAIRWSSASYAHGNVADYCIAYSGAVIGVAANGKLKAYKSCEEFCEKLSSGAKPASLLYWAEDAKIMEIKKALAKRGPFLRARSAVPRADALLRYSQDKKAKMFFTNTARPIYLKKSWK